MFIRKVGNTPMNAKQTVKGFTIIEVVLVLAIAGLIFLMVFIALPALQSGQRDTARKNDVGSVASAVNSYTSNNRGQFPDSTALTSYAKNVSTNTSTITIAALNGTTVSVKDGDIKVVTAATCDTAGATGDDAVYNLKKGTTRQYVTVVRLEANGGTAFCQDS
jgi:type IV pilus assembly protein PilA